VVSDVKKTNHDEGQSKKGRNAEKIIHGKSNRRYWTTPNKIAIARRMNVAQGLAVSGETFTCQQKDIKWIDQGNDGGRNFFGLRTGYFTQTLL
jgi:hypothetical protein